MVFKEYGNYDAVGLADLVRKKRATGSRLHGPTDNPWNLDHSSAGSSKARLPFGMMFAARFGDEGTLLRPGGPTRTGQALEAPDTADLRLKDKTQPHSEARKRYRAATGTPIPQTELDPEAES